MKTLYTFMNLNYIGNIGDIFLTLVAACFFPDCMDTSPENLHENAPTMHALQETDVKQNSNF